MIVDCNLNTGITVNPGFEARHMHSTNGRVVFFFLGGGGGSQQAFQCSLLSLYSQNLPALSPNKVMVASTKSSGCDSSSTISKADNQD